jgi:hypothetical protein
MENIETVAKTTPLQYITIGNSNQNPHIPPPMVPSFQSSGRSVNCLGSITIGGSNYIGQNPPVQEPYSRRIENIETVAKTTPLQKYDPAIHGPCPWRNDSNIGLVKESHQYSFPDVNPKKKDDEVSPTSSAPPTTEDMYKLMNDPIVPDKFTKSLMVGTLIQIIHLDIYLRTILKQIVRLFIDGNPTIASIKNILLCRLIVPDVDKPTELFVERMCENYDLERGTVALREHSLKNQELNATFHAIADIIRSEKTEEERLDAISNILI